ncbi:AarF/ABC1/UbiB kinase family protein [Lutimaribacter sp. EGI FJ00015]|uniref:AarF/ABC1/UbiB kinase family protein n=1 Tax=Lutimaribacter degradans TaxID=2945989 RepID=A0ACC5ZXZ9_9RHOB|nr:AarF/ABC1/UbiB kinase family protein [Lutimaribacter sp. EGI FJ00013]MCM2562980.1 AarF/ABC1/UbiB kinase family protein [Lutimaribacter sp. EGI FJ00013]MCO0614148.1 AarF/ABC1/UbiB kinase family protein [Lutimaribacter sp. EGI FJ00015]MCO0636125.1 AarF/ABC1/UbiB kinase family protein [Lutimaribacter sp. EGI FJ00014]
MTKSTSNASRPLAVPAGRINRFARLGSMTAGIAGNMAVSALGPLGRGTRPEMRRLLMTPANMRRLADELSRMRGAAMKMGQLISMDAGEVLPPELAGIMARLRDQAHVMPPAQLKQVLTRNWGGDWQRHFRQFDVRPIAAASIGQVHRARLRDGRDVAIKVQYPGIANSIDSDVANVGALVRMSGLLPGGFDLAPYMEEARSQLHEETDYTREGAHLERFARLLADSAAFALPMFHADWSTRKILTMSFLEGRPIETAAEAPQAERNGIMGSLIDLTLREVFEFGLTQSDPNFANYRYNAETGRIVLLDFGATRALDPSLTGGYRRLMRAGLEGNAPALQVAAQELRFIKGDGTFDAHILAMIGTVFDAIRGAEAFEFADRTLSARMNEQGMALAQAGYVPPPLPMDVLYLQRKFGGMFLLGSRLGATLPVEAYLRRYLE